MKISVFSLAQTRHVSIGNNPMIKTILILLFLFFSSFAFAKDSKLRDDFDKYLNELGPKKIQAILEKWMK